MTRYSYTTQHPLVPSHTLLIYNSAPFGIMSYNHTYTTQHPLVPSHTLLIYNSAPFGTKSQTTHIQLSTLWYQVTRYSYTTQHPLVPNHKLFIYNSAPFGKMSYNHSWTIQHLLVSNHIITPLTNPLVPCHHSHTTQHPLGPIQIVTHIQFSTFWYQIIPSHIKKTFCTESTLFKIFIYV